MPDTRSYCRSYIERGLVVVPVPPGKKGPVMAGWPDLRISAEQVSTYFDSDSNVGVVLGAASGNLTDIDLDSDLAVALAPMILPPTPLRHGRLRRPASHWWYVATEELDPVQLRDLDRSVVLEIRSRRQQTLLPPSLHPSGDHYTWDSWGQPASIEPLLLRARALELAASAVLVNAVGSSLLQVSVQRHIRGILDEAQLGSSALSAAQEHVRSRANTVPYAGAWHGKTAEHIRSHFLRWQGVKTPREASGIGPRSPRRCKKTARAVVHCRSNPVLRELEDHGCQPVSTSSGFAAKCPAHDDRRASLALSEGAAGRVLVHCHAGCSTPDVLGSLGLDYRDLFPVSLRRRSQRRSS